LSGRVAKQNEELLRAYALTFGSPAGKAVLADLATFCRATESCFDPDPRIHAVLEGRRETFLRIQQFAKLNAEEIYDLRIRRTAAPPTGDEQ
jgi:hypothetical protein